MARLPVFAMAAMPALLVFGIAPASGETVTASVDTPPVVHILMRPVQRELEGPDPFDRPSMFGFRDLGFMSGMLAGVLAGVALDGALDHMDSTFAIDKVARPLGDGFDFRHAMYEVISGLDRGTGFDISEVHEQKHSNCKSVVQRIMRETDADYVLCLDPTWFIAPDLNQLRFLVNVGFYAELDRVEVAKGPYKRKYEYLSPSRGILLRPFREGEKAALVEAINRHFDRKVEQYPHNRDAYAKDRKHALQEIKEREVIPPPMAIAEGWPGNSIPIELQLATDNVMALVHADLMDPHAALPADSDYLEFSGLDLKGRPVKFKGQEIGTQGANTVYRDPEGNVYSVPGQ